MMYGIGKHIKLKPELKDELWYTDKILQVLSYSLNYNEKVYVVNFEFLNTKPGELGELNLLHPIHVYCDKECDIFDRRLKLKQLKTCMK